MHWTVVNSFFALLAFGVAAFADEASRDGGSCPVAEKVSKVLASWRQAAQDVKGQAPAEREKSQQRFIALAKECPVGSRIGPSLVAAREVLASMKCCSEASTKSCPLANATPEQKKTAPFVAGEALLAARSKLLSDLLELATYASACSSGSSCCAAETAAKAGGEPAGAKAECAKTSGAACQVELAVRIGALKASWAGVGEDLAKLPAAKKAAIRTEFESLAKSCQAVALMPSTVFALSEGFDALDTLHGKMGEWAQANAALFQSVPEEAKRAFESNLALVRHTRDVLRLAADTLKAGGHGAEGGAAKETAARNN